jgi:hypothetical protein
MGAMTGATSKPAAGTWGTGPVLTISAESLAVQHISGCDTGQLQYNPSQGVVVAQRAAGRQPVERPPRAAISSPKDILWYRVIVRRDVRRYRCDNAHRSLLSTEIGGGSS